MRRPTIACLIGLLPLATGCTVSRQIAANVYYEKKLFHSVEKQEERIEDDAEDLLKTIAGRHPHKEFTHDFRSGFKDGYRDFLIYGGPIRPPASPPPRYRTAKSLTPHGHCKVRDYNLGFIYGAECADATGKRQFFTLPILVTDQTPPPPLDIVVLPNPPEGLSTDGKKPPTNAETPPATPGPVVPSTPPVTPPPESPPKTEIPKSMPPQDPKPPLPTAPMPMTPVPTAPTTPMPMTPAPTTPTTPMPMTPTPPAPVPTPKVEPKYDPIPKPVEPPKVDPIPKPTTQAIPVPSPTIPVPIVPASNPNAIPLVPTLPSVSLAPAMAAPIVVPVSGTK